MMDTILHWVDHPAVRRTSIIKKNCLNISRLFPLFRQINVYIGTSEKIRGRKQLFQRFLPAQMTCIHPFKENVVLCIAYFSLPSIVFPFTLISGSLLFIYIPSASMVSLIRI